MKVGCDKEAAEVDMNEMKLVYQFAGVLYEFPSDFPYEHGGAEVFVGNSRNNGLEPLEGLYPVKHQTPPGRWSNQMVGLMTDHFAEDDVLEEEDFGKGHSRGLFLLERLLERIDGFWTG